MRDFIVDSLAFLAWLAVVCIIGFALTASLVKSQPAASPSEQALGNKLHAELVAGLQCSSELIQARAKIAELEAKLKPAEPKK